MNILFVIESFTIGGAEKSLVNLLNTLDFSDHEVTVVVFARGGALEAQLPDFINLIHLPHQFSLLRRIKFFLCRKVLRPQQTEDLFWKIFNREVPGFGGSWDVAVAYGQGFPTHFVAEKINACRKLAWVNTDYIKAGYSAAFDAHAYEKIETVVAVSQAVKESLQKAFRGFGTPLTIQVIEDLLGLSVIDKLAQESTDIPNFKGLKLVSVGRLHSSKGYSLAIEAASILKEKGISFKWWIVGEGPERPSLAKQIAGNGLQGYVILQGADTNPYKFMNAADIYVQTSIYEGYSITVREALALRKVVLSTNFPSVTSAIQDGYNGFLCSMDAKAIADKILFANAESFSITQNIKQCSEKIKNDEYSKAGLIKSLLS